MDVEGGGPPPHFAAAKINDCAFVNFDSVVEEGGGVFFKLEIFDKNGIALYLEL
jgi:uncharacterized protein (DUF2252 family)